SRATRSPGSTAWAKAAARACVSASPRLSKDTGAWGVSNRASGLLELDLDDLVLARTARGVEDDLVALAVADERARDGRLVADLARLQVRLVHADDLVCDLLVGVQVDERDRGPEDDLVPLQRRCVDDLRAGELVL